MSTRLHFHFQIAFAYYEKGIMIPEQHVHMVEPFGLKLALYQCLTPESEDLAKMKVKGQIEKISAKVLDQGTRAFGLLCGHEGPIDCFLWGGDCGVSAGN